MYGINEPSLRNSMLKSSVTMEYAPDSRVATASLTLDATDVKLQASISEATFDVSPSLSTLVLSIEKPASLSIDYNIPNQDLRLQFTSKGNLLDNEVNMRYTHWIKENKIAFDGTMLIDSKNKVSANYEIGTKNCKLKYSYVEGDGARIFEPCYNLADNSWGISLWQHFYDHNLLRASFQSSTQVLGLEWSRASSYSGSFKVLASLNLTERIKIPKIRAESTWDLNL